MHGETSRFKIVLVKSIKQHGGRSNEDIANQNKCLPSYKKTITSVLILQFYQVLNIFTSLFSQNLSLSF